MKSSLWQQVLWACSLFLLLSDALWCEYTTVCLFVLLLVSIWAVSHSWSSWIMLFSPILPCPFCTWMSLSAGFTLRNGVLGHRVCLASAFVDTIFKFLLSSLATKTPLDGNWSQSRPTPNLFSMWKPRVNFQKRQMEPGVSIRPCSSWRTPADPQLDLLCFPCMRAACHWVGVRGGVEIPFFWVPTRGRERFFWEVCTADITVVT